MENLRTEGTCKRESRWTTANNYNVRIFPPYRVCWRSRRVPP